MPTPTTELEALVKSLKGLAAQHIKAAEKEEYSVYAKGLSDGAALAYEAAARWLERILAGDVTEVTTKTE